MKSDVIRVSSRGDEIDRVLMTAEKVAEYQTLSHKSALHLRLMAEELMNLMRAITGDVLGEFWIENKRNIYELHLKVQTLMDFSQREKLLAASKSGKNEAAKGFTGRLRSFFEPIDGIPVIFGFNAEGVYTDVSWSMHAYQQELQRHLEEKNTGAREAWDELEKSVLSHIADDIRVSIRGREVEMVIFKKMN